MLSLRSMLFLSVLATPLLVSSCAQTQSMLSNVLKNMEKPTARLSDASIADLDAQSATIDLKMDISNPYALPLPLSNLKYNLAVGEGATEPLFSGEAKHLQRMIPAKGTETVTLPVRVEFAQLLNAVQGIRPGMVLPYKAGVDILVEPPAETGAAPLSLPVVHQGQLPVPAPPQVSVSRFEWGKMSLTEATGNVTLNVKNTNEFAATLSRLSYDLDLNGKPLVSGLTTDKLALKANDAGELVIPFSVSPRNLGSALLNLARGGEADYSLGGVADLDTPFGPIKMDYATRDKVKTEKAP